MRHDSEKGQAIILVLVALSIFLLGGVGLAIDASQLYAQRQMAQAAADGAAQAGIMSIYDNTNTAAYNNAFGALGDGPFNCTAGNAGLTPCAYTLRNGFGTPNDVVTVDFPTSAAGVTLSTKDPVSLIRVKITRNLSTGLIRFVGPSTASITATATAAILAVVSPVPILVLHPTMSGSFQKNGGNTIQICGGPTRSIQVNSESATSISISGNGVVDLSKAGPKATTPTSCDGEGADFGDFGGPTTYPGVLTLGTDGSFIQPASPIQDVLIDVPAPTAPLVIGIKTATILPGNCSFTNTPCAVGVADCPATMPNNCTLYSPGLYTGGINPANKELSLFKPGVYYLNGGGFHYTSNRVFRMAKGFPNDLVTGQGVVFYNTGNGAQDFFEITSNSGQVQGVTYGNQLLGAPESSIYAGIAFFQDRTSVAHNHNLQGGGGISITGTIYLTNTEPTMRADPLHYQSLSLQGNPGSATTITGQIIVDALSLGGTADITMHLSALSVLVVRKVALVR